jgi:haloacetate dehalogenase
MPGPDARFPEDSVPLPPSPLLPGFARAWVAVGEVEIAVALAGSGPPLLLLHGYPQTHAMWHRIAPALAERRTVVLADLRGYGESSRPPGGEDHEGYSKRAMAADQVRVMEALGISRFAVVGHDRGARVAHRMALDWPEHVERLAVLDIVPTRHVFRAIEQGMATAYFHWFFLIQPDGVPERMIGADPDAWLRWLHARWAADADAIDPDALEEYAVIHASCADYRAAATIDLRHDDADVAAGRRVGQPLLALWGTRGRVGRAYDVPAVWREVAARVEAAPVDCGHFPAEERPHETLAALEAFLAGDAQPVVAPSGAG